MNKSKRYTMCCIAGDENKSVIVELTSDVRLREMPQDDLQMLMERFAEKSSVWNDVLDGKGTAVIYDVESFEYVCYSDGIFEWILE